LVGRWGRFNLKTAKSSKKRRKFSAAVGVSKGNKTAIRNSQVRPEVGKIIFASILFKSKTKKPCSPKKVLLSGKDYYKAEVTTTFSRFIMSPLLANNEDWAFFIR
jgi:hypothetical protein